MSTRRQPTAMARDEARARPRDEGRAGRVDRRIVERRRQVARDRVRGRRRLVLLAVVAGLLAVLLWRLSDSSLFGLSGVEVTGVRELTAAQVVRASAVRVGEPVLRIDLEAVRARVERLPWVEHATVTRVAPSGLRIRVTERTAAASLAGGGRYWLVAADGTVLEAAGRYPKDRPRGIPHVGGVPVGDYAPGVRLPPRGPLANALAALAGMDPALRRLVTGVTARTEASLAFGLRGGAVLQYGIAERQAAKDEAALLLLENAQAQGRKVVRIDVRAPRTPVLQATNSGAVVEKGRQRSVESRDGRG
jgi:cell division protein FtsQ